MGYGCLSRRLCLIARDPHSACCHGLLGWKLQTCLSLASLPAKATAAAGQAPTASSLARTHANLKHSGSRRSPAATYAWPDPGRARCRGRQGFAPRTAARLRPPQRF